ncbi:hypothetical protein OG496_12370 [Streptomyces sp. NBC_00988]|uniref:hypothetical protein n=1 Tax=Streptomyces sp. NBC_00988 TaxID=2903704 RepID=UPI00386EFF5F|nr:hypothetical protein OG496_12370 [Streptomyces sp. NBC_00988]
MTAPFHVIDTATGEVVRELRRDWSVTAARPRRRTKRAQTQTTQDFVIAAGLVLGVWLSFVVMP